MTEPLGISGRLARAFQANPLTPILALAGLLLGVFATVITPREEEPQIDVTMANISVPFAGASARDVELLVSTPLEKLLSEIEGVKHVYSVSQPGMAIITVEFTVGIARKDALVRLYNQVYAHADWAPPGLGVGQALVRPMGIDDVPIMSVTLSADAQAGEHWRGPSELAEIAHTLETEIKRIPGTRDVYTLGAPQRAVLVELDATRLAAHGLTASDLIAALSAANAVTQIGERVSADGVMPMTAGRYLADAQDVRELVIGLADGDPVYLSDVARIERNTALASEYVWTTTEHRDGETIRSPHSATTPAVTLAIAKKPGANAVAITREITRRIANWNNTLIPEGVHVSITRDYGATANDKAIKLIQKLIFATLSVIALVWFALGWREAIVVGSAVVLTLSLTLFASWALGFTINRVSLFALIFSIGILVDDAIVVVENIHRHMSRGGKSLRDAIPPAVNEVGSPTILATFTVIAALLPMAFVSGLMGPYMRPIPINASAGMLLSLLVALTVTPWLSCKLLAHSSTTISAHELARGGRLQRLFERVLRPFLRGAEGRRRRKRLFVAIVIALAVSAGLAAVQWVVLKMLPFDNKSEFQVVVDLPEGTPLERTNALLLELAGELMTDKEVLNVQGYAGTSAPFNFNGLVRQYYLRRGATMGDLQVNLTDKHQRSRQSHDIARALRPALANLGERYQASVKIVEVPPGPPVLSPLVAEIYGPDSTQTRQLALAVQARFAATPGIVDIDTSLVADAPQARVSIDRARAARLGISQREIADTLQLAVSGRDSTYLHDGRSNYPTPVRLQLSAGDQADNAQLTDLRLRAGDGQLVPLSELVSIESQPWQQSIYHKDLLPVSYVTGDEAGSKDSPLYGMFSVVGSIHKTPLASAGLTQYFFSAPDDSSDFSLKWDGEWQITFETFRDMGLAYAVGLLLIYLLVVAQFRDYVVPLVIMAPIPLTVIGVMPGHALLGAQFTATSMIGMIALAGIIVRNSILLVDFVNQALAEGHDLADAVIEACAVRAQPIMLTALAAMAGALFILDDPIFNGLAIALIFGIAVSTVLTLLVIPLLYFSLLSWRARHRES